MNGCECKRGFFTLRACGEAAIGPCQTCLRAMCAEHAASPTQCLDCASRERQGNGTAWNGHDDDLWIYRHRERMHTSAGAGTAGSALPVQAFDQHDRNAFDQPDVERDDGDDDARGGFGDS
jgi:hypothetical protein